MSRWFYDKQIKEATKYLSDGLFNSRIKNFEDNVDTEPTRQTSDLNAYKFFKNIDSFIMENGYINYDKICKQCFIDMAGYSLMTLLLTKESVLEMNLCKQCESCGEWIYTKNMITLCSDDMICSCGNDNRLNEDNSDQLDSELNKVYAVFKLINWIKLEDGTMCNMDEKEESNDRK